MGDHVRVRLDPGEQPGERHHLDDAQARREPILAVDRRDQPGMVVVALDALEERQIVLEKDPRLGVQDIDRPRAFRLVALADLEIVEVVGRA